MTAKLESIFWWRRERDLRDEIERLQRQLNNMFAENERLKQTLDTIIIAARDARG